MSDPQLRWGLQVLDRLELSGDETVLDAGCGSGRLTAELLARLPRGRVVALDASANMLAQARASLEPVASGRVTYVQADLAAFELDSPVDAVFSAATFHWVLDHDALFANLYRALRPGGALVAQCGGEGNLDRLRERGERLMKAPRFAKRFEGWTDAWRYAGAEETRARMEKAGFTAIRVWLEDAPTTFPDEAAFREFASAVVLRAYLARLPDAEERSELVKAIVAEAATDSPPFTLDYVRLNVDGRRPAGRAPPPPGRRR